MLKAIEALKVSVLFLAVALASTAALASPTLLYTFTTSSFGARCSTDGSLPCSQDYSGYRSALDAMTITLEQTALSGGTANLTIQQVGQYSPVSIANDGVSAVSLALYPSPPTSIALDESVYSLNGGFFYFDLAMQLAVETTLSGLIRVNDGSSEIGFATSPGSLGWLLDTQLLLPTSTPTEWTGFVRSDALSSDLLLFTGEWRLARTVPEPDTLALMLLACIGWSVVAARRSRP